MTGWWPSPGIPDVWWIDRAREATRRQDDAAIDVDAADALGSAVRRTRFLIGRRAVRRILASYLGLTPAAVPINVTAGGKPVLPDRYGLAISISHCGRWTTLAVAISATIGIDAADHDDVAAAGAAAVMLVASAREREDLEKSGVDQSRQRRLWVRKEAVGKALGGGLLADLQAIDIGLCEAAQPRAVMTPRGVFCIIDCPAPAHVTAALCAAPPLTALRLQDAARL